MMKLKTKHCLTGTELSRPELTELLFLAESCREQRLAGFSRDDLAQQNGRVLLFEKPSLRTRVSFSVAVQELGGFVMELENRSQKKEDPEDTIRVLAGYCHADDGAHARALGARAHGGSLADSDHQWPFGHASPLPGVCGLTDA